MTAAPGIVTSGTGPPNAVVQVQPGMQVQPVVLVDQNGQYVTTSGSAATAGYLADLTGSVNVSQAAAPATGQVLTATSGTTATWQSGSAETAGYLATQTTSVYVAGGSAPSVNMELIATSGSAATWQFGASGVLTTLGDMLFENSTPALARLAGNTSSTKMFLTQTGTGTVSANPAWGTIASADMPTATTSVQGAVIFGGTVTSLAAPAPTAVLGSSGYPADLGHVHPSSPAASQTLGSAATSIAFSNIPASYSVLRLLVIGASNAAAEATRWQVRLNGDSGSHYDVQGVFGAGNSGNSAQYSSNATQQWIGATGGNNDLPAGSATAGVAGIVEVTVPAYAATTFQKTGLWRSGYFDGATGADSGLWTQVVAWRSGSAITSVSVTAAAGSLITGTTAYLYLS